jgi:hypothetical protein
LRKLQSARRRALSVVPVRRSRPFVVGLAGTVSVLLVLAASALAAPVDVASDHALVHAYKAFLHGALSDVPAWRQADDAYRSNISASCPNVLAAVNLLPSSQINQAAATAFGEEVAGDLLVSQGPLMLDRLSKLQTSISRLRWSNGKARATVNRYLSAGKALYSMAPSDLCADATAFAASGAKTTPPGTLGWLATFGTLDDRNGTAGGALRALVGKYHSSRDTGSVKDVLKLLNRLQAVESNVLQDEGSKLLPALGLTL